MQWFYKQEKHSCETGRVQGLKMSEKATIVQRKPLKDFQKAGELKVWLTEK